MQCVSMQIRNISCHSFAAPILLVSQESGYADSQACGIVCFRDGARMLTHYLYFILRFILCSAIRIADVVSVMPGQNRKKKDMSRTAVVFLERRTYKHHLLLLGQ